MTYSLILRAANLQKSSPRTSKRLWKLYDRLALFLEKVAPKKGK